MTLELKLKRIMGELDNAVKELEAAPEKANIVELIEYCLDLDETFKEWCQEQDDEYGDKTGTNYETGKAVNLEFYIEGDWMFRFSQIIRKFKESKDESSKESC